MEVPRRRNTLTAGSSVPQYTGLAFPGPYFVHDVLPTEYFLLQSLVPKFSVLLGKIDVLTVCDQTLFGNSYKFDFANLNFNKNPMALNFYNTTSLSAVGGWAPSRKLLVAAGVFDPNSQANNFATKAFDRINVYGTAIFSYNIGNLPGQSWAQFNWTDKPKIDLGAPFGQLPPGTNSQALGILLGSPSIRGVPINYKSDSWVTLGNVSQYLFVKDHSEAIAGKLANGQPLRGIGVFGRLGYAPEQTNTITRDASIALFAHGLFDFRKNDSFGTGFYHNAISGPLKLDIAQLTGGNATVQDEKGSELFYDFAVTPALRFIPSYQHIWNPLTAEADEKSTQHGCVPCSLHRDLVTNELVSVLMLHGDSNQTDILQNAIDLGHVLGPQHPKVAILPAVETVSPKIQATLGPAILCQNGRPRTVSPVRILDGPLDFDNAVSTEVARAKGIVSPVAGEADIFIMPALEAGNMLQSSLNTWQKRRWLAPFGSRVHIVLTSRADKAQVRLACCAIALMLAIAGTLVSTG